MEWLLADEWTFPWSGFLVTEVYSNCGCPIYKCPQRIISSRFWEGYLFHAIRRLVCWRSVTLHAFLSCDHSVETSPSSLVNWSSMEPDDSSLCSDLWVHCLFSVHDTFYAPKQFLVLDFIFSSLHVNSCRRARSCKFLPSPLSRDYVCSSLLGGHIEKFRASSLR